MSNKTKERLNRLFTTACDRLAQDGCKLLPYDYVELHRLAVRAVEPDPCSVSLFSVPPVCVGRAVLWLPTIGAMLWWSQCGRERYGNDDTLSIIAYAYMCHYGREQARIESLYSKSESDSALVKFRMWLGSSATTAELKAGIDKMNAALESAFPDDGEDETEEYPSAIRWGDIVARLCGAYSEINPRLVLYSLSPDECAAMLEAAPVPFGMKQPEKDSAFLATVAFQNHVRKLRKERA